MEILSALDVFKNGRVFCPFADSIIFVIDTTEDEYFW